VEPELANATAADGVTIAWTSVGSGPVLVYLPGVPFSNAAAEWRIPVLQRAYTSLADRLRLIQFDGRGSGRSQRDVTDLSLDAHLRDIDAVVEAAHVDECVLLGFYLSATLAIAWAARHPARVRGLILFGGALRGSDQMRGPGTQALLSLIERDWNTFVESITHAWLGWPAGEEGHLAADWFRTATSPANARATLRAASAIDVTVDAARVACPVLVLHRAEASVIPFELSAQLARTLPAGRLEVMPGSSAGLFFEETDPVVDWIVSFVIDPQAQPIRSPARRSRSARGSGGLSPRETEVLRLLAGGESNGQIADRLGLSINTVERHVSNLYRKIDARGRAEATAWAIRNGVA
jgi:pimeloyl-ACP methyl ester carboxylesterase/DNA-binding CsgD family transcriptional regulator